MSTTTTTNSTASDQLREIREVQRVEERLAASKRIEAREHSEGLVGELTKVVEGVGRAGAMLRGDGYS